MARNNNNVVVVSEPVEVLNLSVSQAKRKVSAEDFKGWVAKINAEKSIARRVEDASIWDAALAWHNAKEVSGLVGKGEGALFATQKDYAVACGFGESYASRLVRLARAAVVHGIRRDSREWSFLGQVASNNPWSGLLMGKDTDALKANLKAHFDSKDLPAVEAAKQTRQAQATADEKAAAEKAAARGEKVVHNLGDARVAIDALFEMSHDFSDDDFTGLVEYLHDRISKEIDRREVLATQAAKAAEKAKKAAATA